MPTAIVNLNLVRFCVGRVPFRALLLPIPDMDERALTPRVAQNVSRRVTRVLAAMVLFSGCQIYAIESGLISADIRLTSFTVYPIEMKSGLAPREATLTITNAGPDSVTLGAADFIVQYILSPTPNPFDQNAINLTPIPIGFTNVAAPAGQAINWDLDALARSDLALPPELNGTFYYFVFGGYQSSFVLDPDLVNNFVMIERPITVAPSCAVQKGLIFSKEEPLSIGMQLLRRNRFEFNSSYGNSWRFFSRDSSFTCQFVAETDSRAFVRVQHLSSYDEGSPAKGSSPVTIRCNDAIVAENFDPASHHGGSHDYVSDGWEIQLRSGVNTLEWHAGALTTAYWIQQIEVSTPPGPAMFSTAEASLDGGFRARLSVPECGPMFLESSSNLREWVQISEIPSDNQANWVLLDTKTTEPQKFFRLRLTSPRGNSLE